MTEYKFHPVAEVMPLMSDDEFVSLKNDIAANGLKEPIWLHEGKIIDGRNRYRACGELGIDPSYRTWDGKGSLVLFVMSLNLHRRHLTAGQKAAIGAEIEPLLAKEAKERQRAAGGDRRSEKARQEKTVVARVPQPIMESEPKAREQAAKLVGTNSRYVQDAKAVRDKSPELHEKVKAGKVTLPQAKREIDRQERQQELQVKAAAAPSPKDGAWQIVIGDCVKELAKQQSGTARLIFADPPYNIGIDYGGGVKDDLLPDEQFVRWCRQWIDECVRILSNDGSLWLLISDEFADYIGVELRKAGLHRRSWIKWFETFGVNQANNFNRCSRHLFYCVKDDRRFVFNPEAVNRPSDRQLKYGDKRADPAGKNWDDIWGINPPIPRLVGTAVERMPDFPTQLPLNLLRPIILCASEPGDLVIDPFNGSGTTGLAAIQNGRRYIGIEKSPKFAAAAELRLKAEGSNKAEVA